MNLKQVQEALKAEGIKKTQSEIQSVLSGLGIALDTVADSDLPDLIAKIKSSIPAGQMQISRGRTKATLGLPQQAENVRNGLDRPALPENQTTSDRQELANQTLHQKILQTANAIADNNANAAAAMPGLIRDMTVIKLNERALEINANWDEATTDIAEMICGI